MAERDWGSRRLEEREAKARRGRWQLFGWALLVPVAVVLVDAATRGSAPGTGPRPAWMEVALSAGLVAAVGWALWRGWKDEDELQWRLSVNALAAMSAATLVLWVAGNGVERAGAGYPALREHLFLLAAAAGLATFGWQRWRS